MVLITLALTLITLTILVMFIKMRHTSSEKVYPQEITDDTTTEKETQAFTPQNINEHPIDSLVIIVDNHTHHPFKPKEEVRVVAKNSIYTYRVMSTTTGVKAIVYHDEIY